MSTENHVAFASTIDIFTSQTKDQIIILTSFCYTWVACKNHGVCYDAGSWLRTVMTTERASVPYSCCHLNRSS